MKCFRQDIYGKMQLLLIPAILIFIIIGATADEESTTEKCQFDYSKENLYCDYATADDLLKVPKGEKVVGCTAIWFMLSKVPVIRRDHLKDFPDVNKLLFREVGIERIEKGAFQDLPNLRTVFVSSNKLTTIDPDVFKSCPNIKTLEIYDNPMLIVPEDKSFLNAPNLMSLNLRNTGIEKLHSLSFENLTGLEYLVLSKNGLTEVPNDFLELLTNIFHLDLSSNSLTEINPHLFEKAESLRELNLNFNPDLIIPENKPFLYSEYIEVLYLRGCNIKKLYFETFKYLQNVAFLDLPENQLTSLPNDVFKGMRNLYRLDLSRNKLTSIEPDIFEGCEMFQHVDISCNLDLILPEKETFFKESKKDYFEIYNGTECSVTFLRRTRISGSTGQSDQMNGTISSELSASISSSLISERTICLYILIFFYILVVG